MKTILALLAATLSCLAYGDYVQLSLTSGTTYLSSGVEFFERSIRSPGLVSATFTGKGVLSFEWRVVDECDGGNATVKLRLDNSYPIPNEHSSSWARVALYVDTSGSHEAWWSYTCTWSPDCNGEGSGQVRNIKWEQNATLSDADVYTYSQNSDGTLTLTGMKSPLSGFVSLPSSIGGRTVTAVGKDAFRSYSAIKSVRIPSSVTSIGPRAFPSGITNVSVSSSFNPAFRVVDNMVIDANNRIVCSAYQKGIYLPSLQKSVFEIPAGVQEICESAFEEAIGSVDELVIPEGVTVIGRRAFAYCWLWQYTKVTLPHSVRQIGEEAFGQGSSDEYSQLSSVGCIPSLDDWYAVDCDYQCDFLWGRSGGDERCCYIAGTKWYFCSRYGNDSTPVMTTLTIPAGTCRIGHHSITDWAKRYEIPASVTEVSETLFCSQESGRPEFYFAGDAPACLACTNSAYYGEHSSWRSAYEFRAQESTIYVTGSAKGWGSVPGYWNGVKIRYQGNVAFKVTLDANGGRCSQTVKSVTNGQPYGALPVPERRGYDFLGWYSIGNSWNYYSKTPTPVETLVNSSTNAGNDKTLYAKWKLSDYAISYVDTKGAKNSNPTTYTVSNAVVFAALPDVDGWTFQGWSPASIAKNSVGDIEVTAQWRALEYEVTFDLAGCGSRVGGGALQQTVSYGSSAVAPEVVGDAHHEFVGWDATFGVVQSNMVVHAIWRNVYAPSDLFGTGAWTVQPCAGGSVRGYDDASLASGASLKMTAAPSSTSWVELVVSNGVSVAFSWKASCEAVSKGQYWDYVSFSIDGLDQSKIAGVTDWQSKSYDIKTPGEHVLRWSFTKDAETSEGEDCGWLADVVVTEIPIEYTLTFDANGGSVSPSSKMIVYGETLGQMPTPVLEGHDFVGWYASKTWDKAVSPSEAVHGNQTVYARWIAKTYTINFDANGGTGGTSVDCAYGSMVTSFPTVEYPGYRLLGWFTASVGGTEISESVEVVGDAVCYAHWEPVSYVITYLNTKGVPNSNPATYTVTNCFSFEALANVSGARFVGWNPTGISVGSTGEKAVTAEWEERAIETLLGCGVTQTGGAADWTAEWCDDRWTCKSGVITKSSETWVELAVTNAVRIVFDWKTSCEEEEGGEMFDGMTLSVDGVPAQTLCGESGWVTDVVQEVAGTGVHTLRWTYAKDSRVNAGEDCAWLANVRIHPVVEVTFDGNGHDTGVVPAAVKGCEGDSFALPSPGSLDKAYHEFVGWQVGDDVLAAGSLVSIANKDMTIKAAWCAKVLSQPIITLPSGVSDREGEKYFTTESIAVEVSAVANATVRYTTDGSEPTELSPVLTGGAFVVDRTMVLKLKSFADDWFASEVVEMSFLRAPWTVSECLNATLSFASAGDAGWTRDLTESHDGKASMRSGAIDNRQTSVLTATVSGAGRISFWCKVSSEFDEGEACDGLRFYVDGVEMTAELLGGEMAWTNLSYDVGTDGPHVLKWQYEKDRVDYADVGSDCAWLDEVCWCPADAIPYIGDNPSAADVAAAVAGAADARVVTKIDETNYNDFRDWAGKVKTTGGSAAGAQGVMNAPNAWMSYALGQGTLLDETPTDDDLSVESFARSAESGKFDFTVSVKNVEVGSEATKENLKKVFGLEGGTTLVEGGLSTANVDIIFGTPKDGKVNFTAGPNAENAGASSFFMKVKLNQ